MEAMLIVLVVVLLAMGVALVRLTSHRPHTDSAELLAQAQAALVQAQAQAAAEAQARAEVLAAAQAREAALQQSLLDAQRATHSNEQLLEAARAMASQVVAEQQNQLIQTAESRFQVLQEKNDVILGQHDQRVVEGLGEMQQRIAQLERQRHEESTTLRQAVIELRDVTTTSQHETRRLAGALRDNRVRGLWGETQLRRVIEVAGMESFCDFVEQRGVSAGDRSARPDVIVRMASDRNVVIDAKVPLDRYLEAANCDDPSQQQALLAEHAKAVAGHVAALSKRQYSDLVDGAVDVVVMFLPGDPFLNAALDADPTLLESAWAKGIILTSPSALFGLLRSLSVGWQERRVAEEAARIAELGRQLHERIGIFAEHYGKVGGHLGRAVEAYNKSVSSMESRLLSTARKLGEHGAESSKALPTVDELAVDAVPRLVINELPAAG